ncbi:MAG: hypothetical protein OFPI_20750 [Osedax symbiont Rs2]|nr:MAG: hypothetical protein OFPI_20750 [Osedax symbiont Rs2]
MIAWFAKHKVAANLLMWVLLIGGYLSADNMRREIIPKLPVSQVTISVSYPGKSAAQIDRQIAQKIQQALQGISGIKHTNIQSNADSLSVEVEKNLDHPIDRLFNDIKENIDKIYDWPVSISRPVVERNEDTFDALMVQLSGDTDRDSLIKVGAELKQALLANPQIHKLEEHGADAYAININIDPIKMRQYQLGFADVASAIEQQSVSGRSGLLKTDNGQFLLFWDETAENKITLQKLLIKVTASGHRIYLSDIAKIDDGFVEHDSALSFNKGATLGFSIKMAADSDVLDISAQAHAVVEQFRPRLADNLALTIWFDNSHYVNDRLQLLQNTALQGFLLVFVILCLFLQMRLAFWVAMGLPIAIGGSFIVLGQLGLDYTVNEITTFGFILVLGILVDDAVVVGESIYSEKARSSADMQLEATLKGIYKVAVPTVFGILTTVVALLPMTRFPSETGRLFAGFAWVVIIALLFSLLESKLILPAHLRSVSVSVTDPCDSSGWAAALRRLRNSPQMALDWVNARCYQPLLRWCLNYRYAWLTCFLALTLSVLGALANGKVRSVFFPEVPGDLIIMTLQLHDNAPLQLSKTAMHKVDSVRDVINQRYSSEFGIAGNIIENSMTVMYEQGLVMVFAEPIARKLRAGIDIKVLAEAWRQPLKKLEAVVSTEVMVSLEGTKSEVQMLLQHPDSKVLNSIIKDADQWLAAQPCVLNVKDSQAKSTPQLVFSLKAEAALFGITPKMLSDQLGAAYASLEVVRFFRQSQLVKVNLKLAREHRNSRADFTEMVIFNDKNQTFPLLAIADVSSELVANSIGRFDGRLTRTMLLEIDTQQSSIEALFDTFEREFVAKMQRQHPDFRVASAGQVEETQASKNGLRNAFIIALLGIYVLLAIPLKQYAQPLIIMAAIPFGIVGAILGHIWLGISVSLYSWLGILALCGVVVNDSLLIVSGYNDFRAAGVGRRQAIVSACSSRFRAIFLTTVTTFAGLYPLLHGESEQAQYLIPAAASMAYGLVFATLISLFLIPLLLVVSTDIRSFVCDK